MALRKEQTDLDEEKASIEALLGYEAKQWQTITVEIRDLKKKYGPETKLGKRRTTSRRRPMSSIVDARRGAGRARAADRPRVAEGLDPGAERSCRGPFAAAVQGRRRHEDLVLRRDDVENPRADQRRQGFHARCLRNCRAGARRASRSG